MKLVLLTALASVTLAAAAGAQVPGGSYGQPGYGAPQAGPTFNQPTLNQPSFNQQGFGQPVGPQPGYAQPVAGGMQALSGDWYYSYAGGADQQPMQAQVDTSGRISVGGSAFIIQGQFQGSAGQAQMHTRARGRDGRPQQTMNLALQFDGGCHIHVTMSSNGQNAGQGMLHVNHKPGAPCPN